MRKLTFFTDINFLEVWKTEWNQDDSAYLIFYLE